MRHAALALVAALALALASRGAEPPLRFEAEAVAQLRGSVTPEGDGLQLVRLFALRRLRDPRLQPLYLGLLDSPHWELQVHGALGLAEISESRRLDPALARRAGADAQEPLVASAIDLGMLGREELRALVAMDELAPGGRLLAWAELAQAGEPVDPALPKSLVSGAAAPVADLAALLLVEHGDPAPFAERNAADRERPARARRERRTRLIEAIRQYDLPRAAPWLQELLSDPDLDGSSRYWGTLALLKLDADAGLAAWERLLGPAPSYADRVRGGLVLLASERRLAARPYERLARGLPDDDRLVRGIVAVGVARSTGTDSPEALVALADLGHPQADAWVMSTLARAETPPEVAIAVYGSMIDALERDDASLARAIDATTRLAEFDLEAVLRRLEQAPDDGAVQEALLLGLMDEPDPAVGLAVARIPRLAAGRADAIALLVHARHAPRLSDEDLQRLGMIAAGGGRVSTGLRARAAWLYLVHGGRAEDALRAITGRDV